MDNNLNWKKHLTQLKNKTAQMAGIFRRVSKVTPQKIDRTIYFSLFHSHILYGAVLLSCCPKRYIDELQVIQNCAIRKLYNIPNRSRIENIYQETKLPQIKTVINTQQKILIHGILNKYLQSNQDLRFNYQYHHHQTRNMQNIHSGSSTLTRNRTLFNAINVYNTIPMEIKNLNKKGFKEKIKSY